MRGGEEMGDLQGAMGLHRATQARTRHDIVAAPKW